MARDRPGQHAPSPRPGLADRVARLTQPIGMRTASYRSGVDAVDGNDVWRLMTSSAAGDVEAVRRLVRRDPNLVNAEYWYQFPIHFAVREGHADVVRFLLDSGAEPGRSRYTYNSWQSLVAEATRRGYGDVLAVLEGALRDRYGYDPEFEPLAQAIRDRDVTRVRTLVDAHPDLAAAADIRGNNAIHWSAHVLRPDLVDFFAQHDADVNAQRCDGQTPAMLTINGDYWHRRPHLLPEEERGHDEKAVVEHLLRRGADYGLSLAIYLEDMGRVRDILHASPSVATELDSSLRSCLYYAALAERADVAVMLTDLGADPAAPETLADTGRALHEAAARSHVPMVRLLLDTGADPNCEVDSSGSALYISKYRDPDGADGQTVRELLRASGATTPSYDMSAEEVLELIDGDVRSELDHGIIQRLFDLDDAALVDAFLTRHPDAMAVVALMGPYPGSQACIDAIFAHGVDPNASDWLGKTWLHYIAGEGDVGVARAFLERGADVNAVESEYRSTPLAEAAKNGHVEMLRFLLEHGADPDVPDEQWARPLAWAVANGHDEAAELLREHNTAV